MERMPSVKTMPPTKLPVSNFNPVFPLELIVGVAAAADADVAVLLWVVFIWGVAGDALVLGAGFVVVVVVVVLFVVIPAVVTLGVTGFKVALVLFVETEGAVLVDGLVGFEVVFVLGTEEARVGFAVLLVGCCTASVWLPPGLFRSTVVLVSADPAGSSPSTATLSSAMTSSTPRATMAQAPREPSPIVPAERGPGASSGSGSGPGGRPLGDRPRRPSARASASPPSSLRRAAARSPEGTR